MKRLLLKLRGFTLIELLVVISIITILAGLTLSTVGYANKKAAMDRSRAEIAGLEVALESYKADNGDYPRSSDVPAFSNLAAEATALNAVTTSLDPCPAATGVPDPTYSKSTLALYIGLSGDVDLDGNNTVNDTINGSRTQIYFNFKPNMLYPRVPAGTARSGSTLVSAVIDPFRFPYGYSALGSGSATLTTGTQAGGYNPTFDLWTTVGGHPGAQATWITNW